MRDSGEASRRLYPPGGRRCGTDHETGGDQVDQDFPRMAAAVVEAREQGCEERTYRRWLAHPFRGKRPPAGKGHGGKPKFPCGTR